MTLRLYLPTVTVLFFLSFIAFGTVHNRLSEIIVCCRLIACDSDPESESVKFYRLQLRLRLHPKRSTPTDSNSGLDSDSESAALVKHFEAKKMCRNGLSGLYHGGWSSRNVYINFSHQLPTKIKIALLYFAL